SLLCKGMNGWPVWLPPLALLAATWFLVRAWAGGRIKERRPLLAALAFGMAAVGWVALNWGFRAWGIPDTGEQLDRQAFRASVPTGRANPAGRKIHEALAEMDDPAGAGAAWLARLGQARRLPVAVLQNPAKEGTGPVLSHLAACEKMTTRLEERSRTLRAAGKPGPAFDRLAEILTLSRALRNKAPWISYRAGVK